jgi:hypothetical protein
MKHITLILLVAMVTCCKHAKKESMNDPLLYLYPVDVDTRVKISLSVLADSIQYVPLETTTEALIGSIDKVKKNDSCYFLLDKKAKVIWCYSLTGKYLHQIDKRGRGEGEYLSMYDFDYDARNGQIGVLDRDGRKIECYDTRGNYRQTIPVNVMARQFAFAGDGILLYTAGTDIFMNKDKNDYGYNFFFCDHEGNILDKSIEYKKATGNVFEITIFEPSGDKTWARYPYNDTIYSFSDSGKIVEKHLFDFGRRRIPIEKINDWETTKAYANKLNMAHVDEIKYSHLFTLVTYTYKGRVNLLIRDNNTQSILNASFIENDMDAVSYANPTPIFLEDNKVFYIKDYLSIRRESTLFRPDDLLSTIQEEDNPFIAIVYLRRESMMK